MDVETPFILFLIVGGAVVTIGGLGKAYIDARRQVGKEQRRIDRTKELMAKEKAALAAIPNDREHEGEQNAAHEFWNGLYAAEGLQRASWGNLTQLPQFEALRLVRELLIGARTNFLVAGVGLVMGTAGSVWDILRG